MATYSCRLCRVNLAASKGCATCDPIRPHIVLSDSDDVSLSEVSKEVVKGLRDQLREYKDDLRVALGPKQREPIHSQVRAVASTLGKVLDASRKLKDDGVQAVELMSSREKMDLFEGYYLALPPAVRARFMTQLQTSEAALNNENAGWQDLSNELTNGN